MLAPSVLAGALLLLVLDGVSRSEPRANVVIAGPTPTAPNPRAAEALKEGGVNAPSIGPHAGPDLKKEAG